MQTIDNSNNLFKNVTANGNVVISGNIELIAIVVNTKGGSSNTAKIYQGQVVDSQKVVGTIDTATSLGRFEYGLPFVGGLLIVVGGGTTPDLTVVYRNL